MKSIYKLLPLMVMVFYACSDYLDITPKDFLVPTKAEDFRLLLDQIRRSAYSQGFYYCTYADTYLSDEIKLTYDPATPSDQQQYKRVVIDDYLFKVRDSDPGWDRMFNQIYVSNLIIERVLDTEGMEALKNQLLAEAKVHRAFAYLLLVNLYAEHYDPATAAEDLGLPLRTTSLPEGSLERASVKQTYEFIINDLTTSIEALPDFPEYNNRPSKASAYAILARVWLYMGNFDKALEFADKSLAIRDDLLDYNTLPQAEGVTGYSDDIKAFPIFYANPEILLAKKRSPDTRYTHLEPSDAQIALFDTDNDIRYTGVFTPYLFSPFPVVLYSSPGNNYIGPSVPEMMLVKAECLARKGEVNKAIDIVNDLRKHRIATAAFANLPYPATAAEALAVVKEERRREFTNKGMRWYDIKRYNVHDNANISIPRTYGEEGVTLKPGDHRWVLPILEEYIIQNPEMEQNPGW